MSYTVRLLAILIMASFVLSSVADAQYREPLFKIHDRGDLWETVKDNGQIGGMFSPFEFYPSLDWPGGPAVLPTKDEQRSNMQGAGLWIGGKNANGSVFFNEMGPFTFADLGTFFEMTEEENFIGSANFNYQEAEEKISAHWITTRGIDVQRVSRAWSYLAFADFIIFEYVFTNTNAENLTDVFLGFPYLIRPSYQDILAHGFWGDNLNVDDEIVGYDATRQLLYAYDAAANESIPWDYGNFVESRGELRSTGYAGYAPLYYDPAKDGSAQPRTVFYAQTINNTQHFTSSSQTSDALYNILSGADASLQAPVGELLSPIMLLGFGPYDMAAGASVKIVIVEAVNGIGQDEAIKGLASQSKLVKGLDSLKKTIDRASALFDSNYVPVSIAPPSPETEKYVLPSTQEIVITWPPDLKDWIDPISNTNDLARYRVYRSDRAFTGPYTRLKEIRLDRSTDISRYFDADLNVWKYKDNTVQVGVGYFYAITSMDADGHESGFTNRNTTALVTATEPADDALSVSVFPNPFRLVSGLPTAGEESSIIFTNLPALCTIRIYTINGELVRTMEHNNPNSGEEVWDQLSDSRQKTAAGVYLYTVESEVGNAKGTLMLIK